MFANKKGSGFAELMVSLTILNIVLLALIPTFVFSTKSTFRNNVRTSAYNLGIRQLERVKSLDFDDVGLESGNPSGVLNYREDLERGGLTYNVKTRVTWIDDSADGIFPTDGDPQDYKRVNVTITAPDLAGIPARNFSTDITRQSQQQIAVGGNIEVSVIDTENNTIEDALFKITSGPSSPQEMYSDEAGRATFVMLNESTEEGDYSLDIEKDGYVVDPSMRNQNTTVRKKETRILQFMMSKPGKLRVSLVDEKNGRQLNSPSNLTLNFPSASPLEYSQDSGSFFIEDLFPGIYEINAENDQYELANEENARIEVGKTTTLILRMKKKSKGNMHLIVTDEDTSEAVPYAAVKITGLDTELSIEDMTNVQGILEKQLGQQSFRLEISKDGYETSITNFSITHTGNTFVRIALAKNTPTGGTIRVLTRRRRNGSPLSGIRIFVLGPSRYRKLIITDSNGEALFSDLSYGRYRVYRWRWGWRRIGRPLIEPGEEKTYTVRY